MRRIVLSVVLTSASLALSGRASAIDLEKMYDPKTAFAETDKNHDGQIDLQEFLDRVDDVFYAADVDKNGFLNAQELERLPFPDDVKDADPNRDGRVSIHEFELTRVHRFEIADTNKDGELSLDEVVAAYEERNKR